MGAYGLYPRNWEGLEDKRPHLRIRGVGAIDASTLLIEVEHGGNLTRIEVGYRRTDDPIAYVRHRCPASERGTPCYHLALAAEVVERVLGRTVFDRSQRVTFPMRADEPAGVVVQDLTPELYGYPGDFPAACYEATKEAEGAFTGRYSLPGDLSPEETEVAAYVGSQGVPQRLLDWVLTFRRRKGEVDESRIRRPKTLFEGPRAVQVALSALSLGKNVCLVGPKATGKNVLCATLSWVLRLPLYELSGHVGIEAADLTADRTLTVDDEGHTRVVWELGALTKAMKAGWLFVADEMNVLRPEVASILHGLDWRRQIEIPGETVKAHPDFRLIATMNHGYAGTVEPSEALMDRFVVVEMTPLGEEQLTSLILRESRLSDPGAAQRLARIHRVLLEKAEHAELDDTRALSVRGLIDAADLVSVGVPMGLAVTACLLNKVLDDHYRKVVEDAVSAILPLGA